jgi:hypothetical protein
MYTARRYHHGLPRAELVIDPIQSHHQASADDLEGFSLAHVTMGRRPLGAGCQEHLQLRDIRVHVEVADEGQGLARLVE